MIYRRSKKQPKAPPQPAAPKVLHSPGGIKGRWMMNSLSFVLVILAAVVILVTVGVSGYYYASVRDNLPSRATLKAETYHKYFTETYDQFYAQAESDVSTFSEQEKLEMQFLDRNGRIPVSYTHLDVYKRQLTYVSFLEEFPIVIQWSTITCSSIPEPLSMI